MPELNTLFDISSLQKILQASVQNTPKNTDLDFRQFLDPDYNNAFKFDLKTYPSTNQTVNNPTTDFMQDYFKSHNEFLAEQEKKKRQESAFNKFKEGISGILTPGTIQAEINPPTELKGELPKKNPTPLDDLGYEHNSANQSLGQWGDLGVQLGQMAGNMIGGNVGNAISRTATGTQTSINAIKNLKQLHELNKIAKQTDSTIEGLNTAKTSNIFALAGSVASVADSFLGEKSEYSGDQGAITQTLDNVYDGISDAAMSMGPVGMLVGGAMKTADLLGDGLGKLGGGTDGMTTQDAILGSSFFSWNVGLINGFGGKKVDTITKDEDIFATVGSSYTGTNNQVDDALTKSGKKYGLFSSNARKKADSLIRESKLQQQKLEGISNQARDRLNLQGSMSAINANRREYDLMGGYNNIRVGKEGLKLGITIEGELPTPLFKIGGELPKLKSIEIEGILPELKVISFQIG